MFRHQNFCDLIRSYSLVAGLISVSIAAPYTARSQDTVEPPDNTIWSTTLAIPKKNDLDPPNIMAALKTSHSDLVLLAAHRGIHALASSGDPLITENSLAAIGRAAQAGLEMIELNVKLTSDGTPILSHDKTWGREWCGLSPVYLGSQVN